MAFLRQGVILHLAFFYLYFSRHARGQIRLPANVKMCLCHPEGIFALAGADLASTCKDSYPETGSRSGTE
jgi:hypothetical protein